MEYTSADLYTEDQKFEIEQGKEMGLRVEVYENPEFLAVQMREIRIGLMENLPVEYYADPKYDWFQMEEIRKGLQDGVNIHLYADASIPFEIMRQIRKGLEEGIDLSASKDLAPGILREVRKARTDKVDIWKYIKEGYDEEQLRQIRIAFKTGVDITPFLSLAYRGVSLKEIRLGLEHQVDVYIYAKPEYNWQQMKEIRLGLERRLDVSLYRKSLYSWQQMREIRLGLEDGLDVTQYSSLMYTAHSMCEKRMELLEKSKVPFSSGNMKEERYAEFSLLVNDNGMEGLILLSDASSPIPQKVLLNALKDNGIVRGIDYAVLKQICEGKAAGDVAVIARGVKPEMGKDGWYEFMFDVDVKAKPVHLEDGSVDYQNAKWFEMVEHGQTLAIYHPATEGKNGYTITGETLPGRKGKELRVLSGSGITLLSDHRTYVAAINGKVEYKDERLEVSAVLVMDNVTLATGNVSFNGSVYVKGAVGEGTRIVASKDILVDGFIGAAQLEAGGDIILRQGNNAAGKGYLKAAGSISGKFFEAAVVTAGTDIHANYCFNSELTAGNAIEISGKNGVIAGGCACAMTVVQAFNIGNQAGLSTKLILGEKNDILLQETAYQEKENKVKQEIQMFKNAQKEFRRKYTPEVRNVNPIYIKIEDAIYTKELELDKIKEKRHLLKKKKEKADMARVVVIGTIYDGVSVEINGVMWNAQLAEHVVLKKSGNHIGVFNSIR